MSEANDDYVILNGLSKRVVDEVFRCLLARRKMADILLVRAKNSTAPVPDLTPTTMMIDDAIGLLPDGDSVSSAEAIQCVIRYLTQPFPSCPPHVEAFNVQQAIRGKPVMVQLMTLKRIMEDEYRCLSQEGNRLAASNFGPELPMNTQRAQSANPEDDPFVKELHEIEERIKNTKFSPEARQKAEKNLKKLSGMNPQSAEAEKIKDYLERLLDYPWGIYTKLNHDIKEAKRIFDEDHYGLERPKEAILDSLVSLTRRGEAKAPILCFVGPPGTGKTSLAKAIARATGRESVRLSVGGMTDENEIRGHRRTYIGSMPGKIILSMTKAKSSNPLFILDEIDKLGRAQGGAYGAVDSALLEVLDPEQNDSFGDRYFDLDVDLSRAMFVTTANDINAIPPALRDRVEIIEFSGYLTEEKIKIATDYLLPDVIKETGIKPEEISISDEALLDVIEGYTREAGARQLKRKLATLCQKALRSILEGGESPVHFTRENLEEYLGKPFGKSNEVSQKDQVGIGHGLAWTAVGGTILPVEVERNYNAPRKPSISATGNIGKVMEESVRVAFNLAMKMAHEKGEFKSKIKKKDPVSLNVHFPGGADPKDGPSAGIVLTTAILSKITNTPIRGGVAMTGEVTSTGKVREIGGLAYKLQAAANDGAKIVIIPKGNEKDLEEEVPQSLKSQFNKIVLVEEIEEVLDVALVTDSKVKQTNEPANDIGCSGSCSSSCKKRKLEP